MNRKRGSELLNYKRKARGVEEPKYNFTAENFIPRKRKRFARYATHESRKYSGRSMLGSITITPQKD